MRVFISWSGDRSRQVAELLNGWLRIVIQASKPWVSTGIDRGALWAGEIGSILSETNVGILCLTAENMDAPWLLFEAGALAKGLPQSRVIPLLIDIGAAEMRMPLSQFNATACDKDGIRQLVHTVNIALLEPLDKSVVEASMAAHWPRFETEFAEILASTDAAPPAAPRSDGDKLDEVLSLVHGLATRIQKIEGNAAARWSEQAMSDYIKSSLKNRAASGLADMGTSIDSIVQKGILRNRGLLGGIDLADIPDKND